MEQILLDAKKDMQLSIVEASLLWSLICEYELWRDFDEYFQNEYGGESFDLNTSFLSVADKEWVNNKIKSSI